MSTRASRFVVPALVGMALLMPGIASAGVSVGIGFGTTFGPYYHHHHHPGYGVSVYAPLWPDYYYYPGYYYDPWYDPWYYPAPVVVSPPPVRPRITVTEHKPAPPKAPDLVGEKLEQKKSESLKKLRIGDPASRLQAVTELEQFARDSKVRTTLEQALLSDRDPQVRKAIAELFGRLQDKNTLKVLKQANTDDSDRAVRQAAYRAIIMIEGY